LSIIYKVLNYIILHDPYQDSDMANTTDV